MSATTYQIDPAHSGVSFKIRHLMIANITGSFGKVTGSVQLDLDNPDASKVEAEFDVTAFYTGDPNRDGHVKGGEFLDVEKHSSVKFTSKKIAKAGDGYQMTGDVTYRGVTKEVTMTTGPILGEAKDPWGNLRRGTEGKLRIKRSDFGITFNAPLETGGVLLADEVDLTVDLEMMRKP